MSSAPNPAELQLSPLVAGAWRLADWGWTPQERLRWIEEQLALGISSFDHADIYGGYEVQSLFGEALALAPAVRERLQLVSKCGIQLALPARPQHRIHHYDTSAAHVRASVEATLRELRTDRLDLLLIHRPDALLDADELAATFEALRREGKVLHFGASNFTPAQFALLHSRVPLATNQVELSPLARGVLHDGTLDQCQQLRIRPMVWSPLAQGRLFTGGDEAARRVQAELQALAAELDASPTTVAMAWVLRHPSRPWPILGSRRLEATRDAVAALHLRLAPEAWYRLWQAGAGHPVP
jgi:predicted oxidoreductase